MMIPVTATAGVVARLVALSLSAVTLAGCAAVPGLGNLGGREACWKDDVPLQAMTLEGQLDIDANGARLALADGRFIDVGFAKYGMTASSNGPARVESDDGRVVAISGERVLLFGGMTPDGRLFHACEVDARQAPDS